MTETNDRGYGYTCICADAVIRPLIMQRRSAVKDAQTRLLYVRAFRVEWGMRTAWNAKIDIRSWSCHGEQVWNGSQVERERSRLCWESQGCLEFHEFQPAPKVSASELWMSFLRAPNLIFLHNTTQTKPNTKLGKFKKWIATTRSWLRSA